MKRLLSFSFLALLLCHALATVWVSVGVWWQEQHDLTEHLTVYSSADSIVEFQVVLDNQQTQELVQRTSEENFVYQGNVYGVVSIELRGDTLYIAGLENDRKGLWQQNLLSFIKHTLSRQAQNDTQKKAHSLLKLLLKDYHLNNHSSITPELLNWLADVRITDAPATLLIRALAVMSPPPQG